MASRPVVLPALVALVAALALTAAPAAHARLAYAVFGGSTLVTFDTNDIPSLTTKGFTGRPPTEAIVGLDVQPSTGQLFALGSAGHLYTVNTQTGALTQVGNPFTLPPSGSDYGFDFNPVTGLIRVVGGAADVNFELDPVNTQVIPHPNVKPPGGLEVFGAAYTNNYAGATGTELIDVAASGPLTLFGQRLSPDDGTLKTIAPLGGGAGFFASLDIGPDNQGFALTDALYAVNVGTGAVTPLSGGLNFGGLALARPLQTTPISASFAPEPVGQLTQATSITVTNTSDAPIAVAPSITGPDANAFEVVVDTCAPAIPVDGACTVGVVSTPIRPGAAAATLTMGGVGTGNDAAIPLSGEGIGAVASFNPTSVAFGTQAVGSATAAQTVTITNTGNSALDVTGVSLDGDVRDFAVRSQTCTAGPIAAAASCAVTVAFDPIDAGAKTAHLRLVDDAPGGGEEVALSGTGASVQFALSANDLTFPSSFVGAASPTQTLTVSNTGEAPLTVSSLAVGGPSLRSFDVASQTCTGSPVPVGGSCAVSVAFEPVAAGAHSATLHVETNARGAQGQVALAGTGLVALVGTGPVPLADPGPARSAGVTFPSRRSFGSRRVGRTRNLTITLRSSGTAPLTISRVRLGGANRGQFRIRSQSCGAGPITPGRRCEIRIAFRPTSPGAKRATLIVADNAAGKPTRIQLAGRGRR